jgi:hypothetical protein
MLRRVCTDQQFLDDRHRPAGEKMVLPKDFPGQGVIRHQSLVFPGRAMDRAFFPQALQDGQHLFRGCAGGEQAFRLLSRWRLHLSGNPPGEQPAEGIEQRRFFHDEV